MKGDSIIMKFFNTLVLSITQIIQAVDDGVYQLPCFQRDFKWNPSRIKSLLNSILHYYPAGSLLFLETDRDNPLIPYQPFKFTDFDPNTKKAEALVLDGQQRMTSCFSVFLNKGLYTYYIDFRELMKLVNSGASVESIDFEPLIVHKRRNKTPSTEIPNGLFPLTYIKDRDTFMSQIKNYVQDVQSDPAMADECSFLTYEFQRYINPILEYEFPIIVLPKTSTLESVCKVFQTINTKGLKLSVFDICVAVFMPNKINLNEMVKNSSSEKKYAGILLKYDATVALQVIALLAGKQPNSNTLPKELNAADISLLWDDAIDGIENTLILFDQFGAGTKCNLSILPYTPMITVVSAVLSRVKYSTMDVPNKAKVAQKIKTYFFTASLIARYTEGTNSKIDDDFKALSLWISTDTVPEIINRGVDWNSEKIVKYNKKGAFGKAVLCILNSLKPNDFYSQQPVGIGETIAACDLHHIFPKAEYGSTYNDIINSVFNFTWLTKDTNIFILDKSTVKYLTKTMDDRGINEDQLKAELTKHLINTECYGYLMTEDYMAFVTKRADAVKEQFTLAGVKISVVNADELVVDNEPEDDDDDEAPND